MLKEFMCARSIELLQKGRGDEVDSNGVEILVHGQKNV